MPTGRTGTPWRLAKSADEQYLLIGPWPHATNTKTIIHGVDFGPEETIDIDGFIVDWLDRQIGGRPENWGDRGRCRIFIMGENAWHDQTDWPPPEVEERSLYLSSGGRANSLFGDGLLAAQPPATHPNRVNPARNEYDPSGIAFDAMHLGCRDSNTWRRKSLLQGHITIRLFRS